ncbi:MAG: ParE family toxin-like protein [Gammaproteobacteria bacterium]
MILRATERFWEAYGSLPVEVKERARTAYRLWRENPQHPSLRFKRIHKREPIYSVRIGIDWRAVGVKSKTDMVWFWIGSHAEYDKLCAQLQRDV